MVKRRFQTSINIARTRSFPWADIESDHDLVMMTFKLHLKKVSKQVHTRIRFDLQKLKDPEVAETFKANDRWEINNIKEISLDIRIGGQKLETVQSFKYLGSVVTDEDQNKKYCPGLPKQLVH